MAPAYALAVQAPPAITLTTIPSAKEALHGSKLIHYLAGLPTAKETFRFIIKQHCKVGRLQRQEGTASPLKCLYMLADSL